MAVPLICFTPVRMTWSAEATAVAAASLREQLGTWLHERGTKPERLNEIMIGVNEALANCVDHAYPANSEPGTMTLKARVDETVGSVDVWVIDDGSWRRPTHRGARDVRGRGIPLMHALADECSIDGRPDGTTVCLRYRGG